MDRSGRLVALAFILVSGAAAAQQATFFESPGFRGRRLTVGGVVDNLANTGYNDRASSLSIRSGVWEICSDAYFRGRCVTLRPGEYRDLRAIGLADNISSARPVGAAGLPGPGPRPPAGRARAILYTNPDFRGEEHVLAGDVPDFANSGFNDRVQSIRIERGSWTFCRDAYYRGGCRTFGPGDYPRLPATLDNAISSARRSR